MKEAAWTGSDAPIKWSTLVKYFVLNWEEKPPKERFLFVDVSRANDLVDIVDEDSIPIGNRAITDRKLLTQFFEVLGQNPKNQEFIICDVFFGDTSPQDKILHRALKKNPNIVISYPFQENSRKPDLPIFKDIPAGLADYENYTNSFLKFKLVYHDTLKTVPLKMYEYLHHKQFKPGLFFPTLGNKSILNHFVVEQRIRNFDLFDQSLDKKFHWIPIQELFIFPEDIPRICKDKIIVIGSFHDKDKHNALLNEIAGPLILLNTFLALEAGDNQISIFFLLYLFFCFALLSFRIVRQKSTPNSWLSKWQIKYLIKIITYTFTISAISWGSYFIFGIQLNIIYLAFWFYMVDWMSKFTYKYFNLSTIK